MTHSQEAHTQEPLRKQLQNVYRSEIGVQEHSGKNDGTRVAEYLNYCQLPEGYAWCAAFISWSFGQIGLPQPRTPWSPALFVKTRRITQIQHVQTGDLFGLYDPSIKRIHHAGFVDGRDANYIITVEGNSNHAVERRRRPIKTIHLYASWL